METEFAHVGLRENKSLTGLQGSQRVLMAKREKQAERAELEQALVAEVEVTSASPW
jgi:hypothetical protein